LIASVILAKKFFSILQISDDFLHLSCSRTDESPLDEIYAIDGIAWLLVSHNRYLDRTSS
jgi:hypothetical protein